MFLIKISEHTGVFFIFYTHNNLLFKKNHFWFLILNLSVSLNTINLVILKSVSDKSISGVLVGLFLCLWFLLSFIHVVPWMPACFDYLRSFTKSLVEIIWFYISSERVTFAFSVISRHWHHLIHIRAWDDPKVQRLQFFLQMYSYDWCAAPWSLSVEPSSP